MTGLRREDELKLKELNELCQQVGRRNLPEDDQLYMLYLEDCYDSFLEEGLRKLRGEYEKESLKGIKRLFRCKSKNNKLECNQHRNNNILTVPSSNSSATGTTTTTTTTTTEEEEEEEERDKESGVSISSHLDKPAAVSSSERCGNKLWSWITDDIVVGGVPHASSHPTAGHLLEFWRQCVARGGSALTVISCLEAEETIPAGFATLKDWQRFTGITEFYLVPFIPSEKQENPPEVSKEMMEELVMLCSNVYNAYPILNNNNNNNNNNKDKNNDSDCRCSPCGKGLCWKFHLGKGKRRFTSDIKTHRIVYIMCKTGQTRSWVLAMVYLMTQYSMEYNEANQLLCRMRAFEPSPSQVEFAFKVSDYIHHPRTVEKTMEEQMYSEVLTQVLSLSPLYRERLLRDLEKLT